MAIIRTVDLGALTRLRTRRADARALYRKRIADLANDRALELIPDAGESLRAVKLMVSRAAKEVGRDVLYGETPEGTLVVWLNSTKQRLRAE